jgi:perosamine synthetase
LAQFERINELVESRRRNARLYNERLKNIPGLTLPVEKDYAKNVYWMYGIIIGKEFGVDREMLMAQLREMGIETRTFFYAIPRQPFLRKAGVKVKGRFPVAERIGRQGLYLPSGSDLTESQIDQISDGLRRVRKGA